LIGRENEKTGSASRDVDDERTQSAGSSSTTASVGQQPSPAEIISLPLRLLRRVATERRTTQLTGIYDRHIISFNHRGAWKAAAPQIFSPSLSPGFCS